MKPIEERTAVTLFSAVEPLFRWAFNVAVSVLLFIAFGIV